MRQETDFRMSLALEEMSSGNPANVFMGLDSGGAVLVPKGARKRPASSSLVCFLHTLLLDCFSSPHVEPVAPSYIPCACTFARACCLYVAAAAFRRPLWSDKFVLPSRPSPTFYHHHLPSLARHAAFFWCEPDAVDPVYSNTSTPCFQSSHTQAIHTATSLTPCRNHQESTLQTKTCPSRQAQRLSPLS